MANEEHLRIFRSGVEAWKRWREANPEVRPDLKSANFRDANLGGANLTGANLERANLTQDQLDSACIMKGGSPPILPEGLKPPPIQ